MLGKPSWPSIGLLRTLKYHFQKLEVGIKGPPKLIESLWKFQRSCTVFSALQMSQGCRKAVTKSSGSGQCHCSHRCGARGICSLTSLYMPLNWMACDYAENDCRSGQVLLTSNAVTQVRPPALVHLEHIFISLQFLQEQSRTTACQSAVRMSHRKYLWIWNYVIKI